MRKLINAIKVFIWAIKYPIVLKHDVFEAMSSLLNFLLKVVNDDRPYITHFGFVNLDEKIVTIWVAPSKYQTPISRLEQLAQENEELKKQLKECQQTI